MPGASLDNAVTSAEQPQVPLVLVQFDQRCYKGTESAVPGTESAVPGTPRVVPVPPLTWTVKVDSFQLRRSMVPLEAGMASTVHAAQGATVGWLVVVPPENDFTRALLYVELSRCVSLAALRVVGPPLTERSFTRWRPQIETIEREYARLRALPHWRDALLHARPAPDPADDGGAGGMDLG